MRTWTEKTIDRIRSGAWTESQMRKARTVMQGALNGRPQHVALTAGDACLILDTIEEVRPPVSDKQAEKGAAYLRALAFRKDGTQRQTPAAKQLRPADLDAIRTVTGFRLVRFELIETGRHADLFPVYRCYGKDGFFDYMAPSWQSGFAFTVERHA